MTILDSFYLLFESDASKLDQGLKETERKAAGLNEKLKGVDVAASKLGGSLMQSLAGLAGAALATLSLTAMTQAMFAATDQADALNLSVDRLGLNIETVSAWGDLIKKNGGSVEGFIGSLEGLNAALTQIEVTGKSRAAPFLKELGIDLDDAKNKGKSAMDFLPEIADAFSKMDKQKSVALGRRLGFDAATIMTLQSGKREIEELIAKEKELGVITKKQGEIADAFGDQMDDTRHAFRSVWLGVSEYVLPPLTWMLEKFQQVAVFMRKHSDFVVGLMIALGAAITLYALPPLFAMASAVIVAFAPFIMAGLLVAALAAGFALLYEDIMTFIEGGDSMIGHIVAKWPIVGDIARGIGAVFVFLWDLLKAFFNFLVTAWDAPGGGFAAFRDAVAEGIDKLIASFPGLKAAVGAVSDAFVSAGEIISAIWGTVLDSINAVASAFDKVKSFFGLKGEGATPGNLPPELRQAARQGQEQLEVARRSPLAAQTSNSIANSAVTNSRTTSVQVGKVEVHTQATDAAGISKAIGGTMQTQMRQAASNYDDGVLA